MMVEALRPQRNFNRRFVVASAAVAILVAALAAIRIGPDEEPDGSPAGIISAVSRGIDAGCSGIRVRPDDDLVAAVARARAGSTICIHRGRHDIGSRSIVPKRGMTLIGARATVDAVGNISALSKIIGTSTNGVIDFKRRAAGVVIRNLDISGSTGTKDDFVGATKKDGRGINGGGGEAIRLRVSFSRIHHNSSLALGGLGRGAVLRRVELDHNGSQSYLGCCSGGIKSANSYSVFKSYIHSNVGNGIWQDVCGADLVVAGNRIIANSLSGVRYEHNAECLGHASITRNVVVGNNTAGETTDAGGIIVNSAPGAQVTLNHLGGNGALGISVHGNRGPVSDTSIRDNFLNGDQVAGCEETGVECINNANLQGGDRTALALVATSAVARGERVGIGGQIAGEVACRSSQEILVQTRTSAGDFRTITTSTTDANGTSQTSLVLLRETVFRLVAPASGTCIEAVSRPATVGVSP
jgi:hypothetical protein